MNSLAIRNAVGAFLIGTAGAASAQSSVTVFGILDVGVTHYRAGGLHKTVESTDGNNSSRLGFRGAEDLGGGLSAAFHLEGAVSADDGQAAGFNFQRRSIVSLISKQAGELRLGRDYTPTFWALSVYNPFGTNGVGHSGEIAYGFNGKSGTAPTIVRSNNQISYFLPNNLGGVYGQLGVAPGEGNAAGGKFYGGRVGYANGPLDVSGAYSATDNFAGTGVQAANIREKFKVWNIGASYDFSVIKVMGLYLVSEQGTQKQSNYLLGGIVPIGAGELKFNFIHADVKNTADDASKYSVGYVHNLSKRTALYTAVARIDNKGSGKGFLIGSSPTPSAGGNSNGYEVGIRHSF